MSNSAIDGVRVAAATAPKGGPAADVVRAWTDSNFQRLSQALQQGARQAARSDPDASVPAADLVEPVEGQPGWLVRPAGRSLKVSVSMPEDLTDAVRQRVGRGAFSQYVTAAVAKQLEVDMLAELAAVLEAEHGPVPAHLLEEARREWPDHGVQ